MSIDPFASPSQGAPQPTGFTAPAGAAQPTGFTAPAGAPPAGAPLPYAAPQSYAAWTPPPAAPLTIGSHATSAKAGAVAAAVGGVGWAVMGYLAAGPLTDATAAGVLLLLLLGLAGALAGYITLSLWMSRVKAIVSAQGYPAPAGWQIWAGWFIPFYGLVAPAKAMHDLGYKAGKGMLTGLLTMWWGGFLLFSLANRIGGIEEVGTDVMAVLSPIMAAASLLSLAGLWMLIGRISRVAVIPPKTSTTPAAWPSAPGFPGATYPGPPSPGQAPQFPAP